MVGPDPIMAGAGRRELEPARDGCDGGAVARPAQDGGRDLEASAIDY